MEFLKKIKDISIENGEWIINRSIFLDLATLEKGILDLNYHGAGQIKDDKIENTKFPPFIQVFYYLVYQIKTVPNEDRLFSEYLNWIGANDDGSGCFRYESKTYDLLGLKARILRSYPSFIRDIHFYYLLLEKGSFDVVKYSLRDDYFNGIDISIIKNKVTFCVSILINTQRGKSFKQKKENRHDYSKVKEIILDVEFKDLNRHGEFYLLGEKQLQILNNKIAEQLRIEEV